VSRRRLALDRPHLVSHYEGPLGKVYFELVGICHEYSAMVDCYEYSAMVDSVFARHIDHVLADGMLRPLD
jgi:hypothetical protein